MNFQQQQAMAQAQAMQRGGAGGVPPNVFVGGQSQPQVFVGGGGGNPADIQARLNQGMALAHQYGNLTPEQSARLNQAHGLASQYAGTGAAGGAPAAAPAAGRSQPQVFVGGQSQPQVFVGGGGGNPADIQARLNQGMALAQQYGNLTPEQSARLNQAHGIASQYAGTGAAGAAGAAGGIPAAPGYAPPAPAGAAPVGGGDSTVITANFPDGCLIGYDRLRNELIINGKTANTRMRLMPARPISAAGSVTSGMGAVMQEAPAEPVEKRGMLTKLGWKKNMMGSDSWQSRYFVLTPTSLSYAKDASSAPLNTIQLNSGVVVNVVNATTPARKNRYENNDAPGAMGAMTMNIGAMKSETSGPIGKDNCVEVIVPGQIGTMLDGIMANNAVGLAFGGGLMDAKKQAQGRTYYLHCSSRAEADEWANAIRNNVAALPQEAMPSAGQIGGANGYAGLNGMMNQAMAMKNTMGPSGDAQDPHKSLDWYKRTLGTQLPNATVYQVLCRFYDDLDRCGVRHG